MAPIRTATDWLVLRATAAAILILLTLNSLFARRRMSHENGITGRGRIRIVDDPAFPDHPFFRAGREFPLRMRHAMVTFFDDACMDVRSIALKFADSDDASPLDIELNTGITSAFESLWHFGIFMVPYIKGKGANLIGYHDRFPIAERGGRGAVRRNPESYARLRYHSQCPTLFRAVDGRTFYAKYRVVPIDDLPESGIPPESELEKVWDQRAYEDETRSPNYMKHELRERLARDGVVRYRLQIQLHPALPGHPAEVCSSWQVWDEAEHPYVDLATIELQELFDYARGNLTQFSIGHQPPSLGLIPARSLKDPNSLNWVRARSAIVRRARLLSYRIFGMPAPIPEFRGAPAPDAPAGAVLAER
jgi:hypothetical protein